MKFREDSLLITSNLFITRKTLMSPEQKRDKIKFVDLLADNHVSEHSARDLKFS